MQNQDISIKNKFLSILNEDLLLINHTAFMFIFVLMKFTFGKAEKLKSRKQIEQLFEEGLSIKEFPLRMRYLKVENLDNQIKIGFSVPKRNFKLAVHRNKIKRLLREAYRKNKHLLLNNVKEQYVIMFIYTDKTEWKYADLEQKMISLLGKFVQNQND